MSDLVAVLKVDTKRRERSGEEVPLHPNLCGPCEDCTEFLNSVGGMGETAAMWRKTGMSPPTAKQVREHEARFGPTAPSRSASPRRGSFAHNVRALTERGLGVAEIAVTLDVAESRVRRVLA